MIPCSCLFLSWYLSVAILAFLLQGLHVCELLYWDVQETYRETIQDQITMSYIINKKTIIVITRAYQLSYCPPSPSFSPWCVCFVRFQNLFSSLHKKKAIIRADENRGIFNAMAYHIHHIAPSVNRPLFHTPVESSKV